MSRLVTFENPPIASIGSFRHAGPLPDIDQLKLKDYFNQYNRLEGILNFKKKRVTKKDLFFIGRDDNLRLN